MKIGKRRIAQANLSDGTIIVVLSPSMSQFASFLDSFNVVSQIGEAFRPLAKMEGGVTQNLTSVKLDQSLLNEFYPLIAELSRVTSSAEVGENLENLTKEKLDVMPALSLEDYLEFDALDGMAVIIAYVKLLSPKSLNPTQAEEAPQELSKEQQT